MGRTAVWATALTNGVGPDLRRHLPTVGAPAGRELSQLVSDACAYYAVMSRSSLRPVSAPRSHVVEGAGRRGRRLRRALLVVVALIAVVALAGLGVYEWRTRFGGSSPAAATDPAASPTAQRATADAEAAPSPADAASPTGTPGAEPSPGAAARVDEQGFSHSDAVGDGSWTVADPVTPSQPGAETVYRYVLRIEGGTGVDAASAAAKVESVLNDDRGWRSVEGVSFEQVADADSADFVLSIATPPTVDELCSPLETNSMWSCRNGDNVAINSDRWNYGSPTFSDIDAYRIYVTNHEVGHFLGHEHEFCAGAGLTSPVMAQQSRTREGGCVENGWPTRDNQTP